MILLPRLALTALMLSAIAAASDHQGRVGPIEQPRDWRYLIHVRSMVIESGHPLYGSFGGLHSVYANRAAVAGLRAGSDDYANGAMFVLDLHPADQEGHAITAGRRKMLAVMVRNSGLYGATGGWGYQAWDAGKPGAPLVSDPGRQCHQCHTQASATGYVFSHWQN